MSEVQPVAPRKRQNKLPIKRRKFVEALLGPAKGNKTEAARIAGYAQPAMEGNRLMNFDSVAEAVESRLAKVTKAMDADEILEGLTQIARGKRPSKITTETGMMQSSDGPVPFDKTKKEYDRKAGYEAMAKIRGLLNEAPPPPAPQVNVAVVLQELPLEMRRQLIDAYRKAGEIEADRTA